MAGCYHHHRGAARSKNIFGMSFVVTSSSIAFQDESLTERSQNRTTANGYYAFEDTVLVRDDQSVTRSGLQRAAGWFLGLAIPTDDRSLEAPGRKAARAVNP